MQRAYCDGIRRRDFLRVGTVAGLSLPQLLRSQAMAGSDQPKKQINCIHIFLVGGMPQMDMWDPKPHMPAGMRSDFAPISTSIPGVQFTEAIPNTAKIADKLAVLRGMVHPDSDHGPGIHYMVTGRRKGAGGQHPHIGSFVSRLKGDDCLLPYVCFPKYLDYAGPGFLGGSHGPFLINSDPADPGFDVRDVTLPAHLTAERNLQRQAALREINRYARETEYLADQVKSLDTFYEKAYGLMSSEKTKEAFDINREPESVRERYGMTSVGQCCLLARRLIEANCRFVSLEHGQWDAHRKQMWSLKNDMCPPFDQAIPTLLEDLEERGLLDSTLVILSTEFGRTPIINENLGRDHWPNAFTVCLAGAGVKTGQVVGATDKIAGSVVDRPMSPEDFTATIYKIMGIDHTQILHTALGRPVPIVDGGTPIHEVLV